MDYTSFTAHWESEPEAKGYILDVSTDADFTSFVIEGLELGDVDNYDVTGLDDSTTYYYRLYAFDSYNVSDASNVIVTLTSASSYDDWFLPSLNELTAMYTNLCDEGVGGFNITEYYWSSSENSATHAKVVFFNNGTTGNSAKGLIYPVRAVRSFITAIGSYSLRDTGPAGGLIFSISGTTYYEAAPSDQSAGKAWSNITGTAIATTGTAIGTGQANTTAIIGQAGHTDSAAKLCNDLII